MRTALFGGTFDPIHTAHLTVAREALSHWKLDQILFIPNGIPPHKSRHGVAAFRHRFRMVELACLGEPRFVASRVEEGNHRSYSIDTIERIKRDRPDDELFFLIGADAFAEIESWRRWRDVLQAVEFIVVTRPGHDYDVPAGSRVHRLETVALPVSSSEIREALTRGDDPLELPRPVLKYIRDHKLYQLSPL